MPRTPPQGARTVDVDDRGQNTAAYWEGVRPKIYLPGFPIVEEVEPKEDP